MARRLRVVRKMPWWVHRGIYGVLWCDVVTLWSTSYWGVPVFAVSRPVGGLRGLDLCNLCEREAVMLLDKGRVPRVVGGEATPVEDPEFSILYPALYSYLTSTKWSDGSPRQTSTLSIFADGGVVKCVLKDRELGICLWCACPSFSGLYGVLEALLLDPSAEWRADRQAPGQKASRVKK